jgi:hypothetical protein
MTLLLLVRVGLNPVHVPNALVHAGTKKDTEDTFTVVVNNISFVGAHLRRDFTIGGMYSPAIRQVYKPQPAQRPIDIRLDVDACLA